MKIAPVADVKARFSEYLKASEQGPIVVTRNGRPVAALLSVVDEDEVERLALAYSPKFQSILRASREQIQAGAGIPHDEFWSQVEKRAGARGKVGSKDHPRELKKSSQVKYGRRSKAETNVVSLAPDVAKVFPTGEAVNEALRLLIKVASSQLSQAPSRRALKAAYRQMARDADREAEALKWAEATSRDAGDDDR